MTEIRHRSILANGSPGGTNSERWCGRLPGDRPRHARIRRDRNTNIGITQFPHRLRPVLGALAELVEGPLALLV
jgi:hypothetical protein